jgi:hypothetical protein
LEEKRERKAEHFRQISEARYGNNPALQRVRTIRRSQEQQEQQANNDTPGSR